MMIILGLISAIALFLLITYTGYGVYVNNNLISKAKDKTVNTFVTTSVVYNGLLTILVIVVMLKFL